MSDILFQLKLSQYYGAEDTEKRKRRLKSAKKQIFVFFNFNQNLS